MKRRFALTTLCLLALLAVLPGAGGISRLTTHAFASAPLDNNGGNNEDNDDNNNNKCPQYGYKHPSCDDVPEQGCFQIHVIGKPIVLEGCEPKNGRDADHVITTNPINNPCPTIPGGPNHAGSFVLHSTGSFPPLSLVAPKNGKLYKVNPGVSGSGACTPISRIVAPGTYEIVYPGARLATPARKKK